MAEKRIMKLDELQGMTVLNSDTGEKIGAVSDIIVHPVEGRVLGLTIRNSEGEVLALGAHELFIGADAVMTRDSAHMEKWEQGDRLAKGALASREMIGVNVVTEDGRLIGRVSDVYVSAERLCAYYKVAESMMQRFLGSGFYISGDIARAYSTDGVRMIVPSDTEDRYAAPSIDEVITRDGGHAVGYEQRYGDEPIKR